MTIWKPFVIRRLIGFLKPRHMIVSSSLPTIFSGFISLYMMLRVRKARDGEEDSTRKSGDQHESRSYSLNIMLFLFATWYHWGMETWIMPRPVLETVTVGVQVMVMLRLGLESPRMLLVDVISTFSSWRPIGQKVTSGVCLELSGVPEQSMLR